MAHRVSACPRRGACVAACSVLTALTSGTGFVLQRKSQDLSLHHDVKSDMLRLVNNHQPWHYRPDSHGCGGFSVGWKSSWAISCAARGKVLVWGYTWVSETCCVRCALRRGLVPVGKLAGRRPTWLEDLTTRVPTQGGWAPSSAPFCSISSLCLSLMHQVSPYSFSLRLSLAGISQSHLEAVPFCVKSGF